MEYTTEQLSEHIRGRFKDLFSSTLQRVMVAFDPFYETWIVNLDNQPEIGDECLSYEFEVGSDDDRMVFRLVAFNCYDKAPTQVILNFPGEGNTLTPIGTDERGEPVEVPKAYWSADMENYGTIDAIRHAMSKMDTNNTEDLRAYGTLAFILAQAGMQEGNGEVIHFEDDHLTRCIDIWVFG